MVIVRLAGGLGNQLFQYAVSLNIAHKLHTELKLDLTDCNKNRDSHHGYYRLGEFNIQENFATPAEIESVNESNCVMLDHRVKNGADWQVLREHFEQHENTDNVFIAGSWMLLREYFYLDIKDILQREFTLKNPVGKTSAFWREKILAANCSVSLHLRHGDYCIPATRTWGMIPTEYYNYCITELKKLYPNITVFVFSDDLQWAVNNFKFDVPTEFVEGCETDAEEWHLMSLCNHNIITNSTFSWGAAWINANPNKIIFSPQGFGIPIESWTYVPVDYSKSLLVKFPPALSIIVYVNNDISKSKISVSSIVSQNIRDYEIIILNDGIGDNGKFCRQFADKDNVTFIRLNSATSKYSAWNKGLDCACGDYVMLLSNEDFIFPNTIHQFLKMTSKNFSQNAPKGIHITHSNYEQTYIDNLANIICAVHRLEENSDGSAIVNGISNRKFYVVVDALFRDMNEIQNFKIAPDQKLMLLASGQLNRLFDTKFFKRKFLNEYNIRFDEHQRGGVAAELKFLTDAFLSTENITLVPQIFCGRLK